MSLSKISITDNLRCAGDEYLYSRARTLLEDMARAGNPASKDHEALLLDVECMVTRLSTRGVRPTNQGDGTVDLGFQAPGAANMEWEGTLDDLLFCGDMDWGELLSSCTQGTWWQE